MYTILEIGLVYVKRVTGKERQSRSEQILIIIKLKYFHGSCVLSPTIGWKHT